jgi:hypothetical protein
MARPARLAARCAAALLLLTAGLAACAALSMCRVGALGASTSAASAQVAGRKMHGWMVDVKASATASHASAASAAGTALAQATGDYGSSSFTGEPAVSPRSGEACLRARFLGACAPAWRAGSILAWRTSHTGHHLPLTDAQAAASTATILGTSSPAAAELQPAPQGQTSAPAASSSPSAAGLQVPAGRFAPLQQLITATSAPQPWNSINQPQQAQQTTSQPQQAQQTTGQPQQAQQTTSQPQQTRQPAEQPTSGQPQQQTPANPCAGTPECPTNDWSAAAVRCVDATISH